jgi:hypothetical protein
MYLSHGIDLVFKDQQFSYKKKLDFESIQAKSMDHEENEVK